mgnify:CR=1 FL=1
MKNFFRIVALTSFSFLSCGENDEPTISAQPYNLIVPYTLDQFLTPMEIPEDNPLTVEGVALGRKLFFDPILSNNESQACATCHLPEASFSDENPTSLGVDGIAGQRNSMAIINLGYTKRLFWDGRSNSLEAQAFLPVTDPVEMHESWPNVESKLANHEVYPQLFQEAFGNIAIDSTLVSKAIAQFERTLLSGNSAFDKYLEGRPTGWNTADFDLALAGFEVFMSEEKGDCFHCHGDKFNPLWTDNLFHNNGLDTELEDFGLGNVSNNASDKGKFKTPTLRNLLFTAPYMHDGRFESLEEVIEHYSTGLKPSSTIDPLMKRVSDGGVNLTAADKASLLMFLKSLTDSSFVAPPMR